MGDGAAGVAVVEGGVGDVPGAGVVGDANSEGVAGDAPGVGAAGGAVVDRVRILCNLYFCFFRCMFLIHVCILKLTVSALLWTVLVSMNQEFL